MLEWLHCSRLNIVRVIEQQSAWQRKREEAEWRRRQLSTAVHTPACVYTHLFMVPWPPTTHAEISVTNPYSGHPKRYERIICELDVFLQSTGCQLRRVHISGRIFFVFWFNARCCPSTRPSSKSKIPSPGILQADVRLFNPVVVKPQKSLSASSQGFFQSHADLWTPSRALLVSSAV